MDVIIIGAGAAGLMAAISAAREGAKVLVLEHLDQPGKKILATGNGRCNFTNKIMGTEYFECSDPSFVTKILTSFSQKDAINFFASIGVLEKERNGCIYPYSEQSLSIRNALWNECYRLGVMIKCKEQIKQIKQIKQGETQENSFFVQTAKQEYTSKSLIIACGLLAGANLGSDGSAFQYVEQFGHSMIDVVPGLVQMKSEQSIFSKLAGIRSEINLKLCVDGQEIYSDNGELQLTKYGISGIVVFQASLKAVKPLRNGHLVEVFIDFLPEFSIEQVNERLVKQFQNQSHLCHKDKLTGFLNDKLAAAFLQEIGIVPESKKAISEKLVLKLAQMIKQFTVKISGTKGYEDCQVCLGGVSIQELNAETLMSKKQQNLFFAGEIIDVVGQCGGYNLQWAWSSGAVAGKAAAMIAKEKDDKNQSN